MPDVKDAPTLSIVTVTRDDASGLRQTLASLERQSAYAEVELVVVDGASRDDTREVLSRLAGNAVIISEPDRGVYDAMNKGWRRSTGRVVQFLNSGDVLLNDGSLQAVLAWLRAEPECHWGIAGAMHAYGGERAVGPIANLPHHPWRHALGLQPHCHQSSFFSRAILEVMGGYSEEFDFVADFDLILRCGIVSSPITLEKPIVLYEGGGMSSRRASEIPQLLSMVRRQRLGLSGLAMLADTVFTQYRGARSRAVHRKARVAGLLGSRRNTRA